MKHLKQASPDQVKMFADCAKNIVEGNIRPSKSKLKKLKKLKNGIRLLAKRSIPLRRKKKILTQKGGIIGSILVPIISAVAGLAIDRLSK